MSNTYDLDGEGFVVSERPDIGPPKIPKDIKRTQIPLGKYLDFLDDPDMKKAIAEVAAKRSTKPKEYSKQGPENFGARTKRNTPDTNEQLYSIAEAVKILGIGRVRAIKLFERSCIEFHQRPFGRNRIGLGVSEDDINQVFEDNPDLVDTRKQDLPKGANGIASKFDAQIVPNVPADSISEHLRRFVNPIEL